jgi:seryl-tRNA(Sec) selenium transferase
LKSLLRAGDPPVVGRIADGVVLLDMLTVDDDELAPLANTMRAAMST